MFSPLLQLSHKPPFLAHAGKMAEKPLLGPFLRVKTHIIIKAPKVCAAYGF